MRRGLLTVGLLKTILRSLVGEHPDPNSFLSVQVKDDSFSASAGPAHIGRGEPDDFFVKVKGTMKPHERKMFSSRFVWFRGSFQFESERELNVW